MCVPAKQILHWVATNIAALQKRGMHVSSMKVMAAITSLFVQFGGTCNADNLGTYLGNLDCNWCLSKFPESNRCTAETFLKSDVVALVKGAKLEKPLAAACVEGGEHYETECIEYEASVLYSFSEVKFLKNTVGITGNLFEESSCHYRRGEFRCLGSTGLRNDKSYLLAIHDSRWVDGFANINLACEVTD